MTTYAERVKQDEEFVQWCAEIGLPLTPLQKILLSRLSFSGGSNIREPFIYSETSGSPDSGQESQ